MKSGDDACGRTAPDESGYTALFKEQWHLYNRGQKSGSASAGKECEDINVINVWPDYRGEGINIAIVDTGIEYEHYDLKENIDKSLSYRYSDKSSDPTPTYVQKLNTGYHGTACAGIAAAVGDNDFGVTGVAPKSTLVGLNVFSLDTSANFADALYSSSRPIDVSSNSWNDMQGALDENSPEFAAIEEGALYGRGGRGIVYLFAAGNERGASESRSYNSNWNRELNNPYVITVASLNAEGKYSSYSNFGANILISAYGGEFGVLSPAIVTTDLSGDYGLDGPGSLQGHFNVDGNENSEFTNLMNGTSAAAPMMAGVCALLLEANPELTYRDVKYILATTARKNDTADTEWSQNGAGYWVNHNYGFGAADAYAAVKKAQTFESLNDMLIKEYDSGAINSFVSFSTPFEAEIDMQDDILIEYVELTLDLPHDSPKDLEITLYSPYETNSTLSHTHDIPYSSSIGDLNLYYNFFTGYTLGSVRYLDESSKGIWRISLKDNVKEDDGTIYGYKLKIYGRSH